MVKNLRAAKSLVKLLQSMRLAGGNGGVYLKGFFFQILAMFMTGPAIFILNTEKLFHFKRRKIF